jgi:hypothetical protein
MQITQITQIIIASITLLSLNNACTSAQTLSTNTNTTPSTLNTQKSTDGSILLKGNRVGYVELERKEKQDFRVDLPKGSYWIFIDHTPTSGKLSGDLSFLKQNGATLNDSNDFNAFNAIRWGGEKVSSRHGSMITLKQNQPLRLRLRNDDDGDGKFWVHIVTAPQKTFSPYGFGATIQSGKIGEAGNTGKLGENQCAFYKVTLPAGKWSISLAAQSAGRAYATLYFNAETGILGDFLIVNADTNESKREEKIITLLKPRTFYFQIWNEGATDTEEISYDLTIQKEN